ncbi:hypothetical protein TruAng_004869 [Truncatella angustata]|nr:hypothetical protein TruAng_004869 [Truncatella angustata]
MACTGEVKREWYTHEKYNSDPAKFKLYETVMDSYATALNFKFNWDGQVANTVDAHRVIQIFQGTAEQFEDNPVVFEDGQKSREKYGPETANRILAALYRQYFEEGKHPSSDATLLAACQEAGVEEVDARRVVVEERDMGRREIGQMVKMAGIDGVDSVPTIIFEGRRRDLTLVGAKEVEEYEKALATIVKESI